MKVKKVMSTVQNINSHPPDMGSVPGSATDLLGESQTNPALSLCVYVVESQITEEGITEEGSLHSQHI